MLHQCPVVRDLGRARQPCPGYSDLDFLKADAGDPLADEASVLACREPPIAVATGEQERAGLPAGQSEILVDGLPRLLGEFEPDRAPVFF